MKFFSILISGISNLSTVPAIWIGKNKRDILWYYMIADFAADTADFFLQELQFKFSQVSNLFLITEFILITGYYKHALLKGKYQGVFTLLLVAIFGAFCFDTYLRIMSVHNDKGQLNYAAGSLFYSIYIVLAIAGFNKLITETPEIYVWRSPLFLTSVAFLFYASGSLPIFIFKDLAIKLNYAEFSKVWIYFFTPLNIFKNILITLSIYRVSTSPNH